MYLFFETIKILDGIPQNIDYHQRRIDNTIRLKYRESLLSSLKETISVPDQFKRGTVKCRIEYTNHQYNTTFDHYSPRNINSLKLVYSDSIIYDYKYCDRQSLNELLKRRANCDEILIVKHNKITDTSFSNIALFDGIVWYTPDTPLLPGTARARMLETGILKEREIQVKDLREFKSFALINSMLNNDLSNTLSVDAITE